MSVAVQNGKTQMITKGEVEKMLSVCSYAEFEGQVQPMTNGRIILSKVDELSRLIVPYSVGS